MAVSRPTGNGQRVQPTRQALIESGLRRFASHGFSRARLTDISADAGVTTGAFYRHFAGKEALYRTLLAQWDRDLTLALGESNDLREACRKWLELSEGAPGVVRAGAELTKAGSDVAHERQRMRQGWVALVTRLLPAGLDPRQSLIAGQILVDTVDYYAYTVVMGWTKRGQADAVGAAIQHLVERGLYGT